MISVYSSLLNFSKGDLVSFLDKIGMYDIFKPLFPPYPDHEAFSSVLNDNSQSIIKYILLGYSIESEMVTIGGDWMKTKRKIFEAALVKPNRELYEGLVHLKSVSVVEAIDNWLQYQDDDLFTQIQMLKDLQIEMRITSVSAIFKASGERDFDQKMKNAEYAIKLKSMIKESESELIQTSDKLKDAVKEIRSVKQSKSFGLETFLKEKES